jgi:hypothetical protein
MSDANPGADNDQTADSAEGETAPTEQRPDDGSGATGTTGSDSSGRSSGQSSGQSEDSGGISDDKLPEDLQPTDDNPLAKPPSDDDEEGGMSLGPDGPQA